MAYDLQFDKIKAVRFGDIEAVPQMTQERRLRVTALKIDARNVEEAASTLSACFGEKAEEVRAFMVANMMVIDLVRLQSYLAGGASGLKEIDSKTEALMKKQVDDAYEKIKAQQSTEVANV